MTNKLLSVIIPVYNVEAYLERCLDSVCNQSYTNLEIICVDDGSTDGSAEILAKFAEKDTRIKVITKRNGGLSSARNVGLTAATGEFVAFVDSDDWLEADAYKFAINRMRDDIDMVVFGVNITGDYNAKQHEQIAKYFRLPSDGIISFFDKKNILAVNHVAWNKIFRLDIIQKYNILFPNKMLHEDQAFFYCYAVLCKNIFCLNIQLYNYFQRENSIMSKLINKQYNIDAIKNIDFIREFYLLNNFRSHADNILNDLFANAFWSTIGRNDTIHMEQILQFATDTVLKLKLNRKWGLVDKLARKEYAKIKPEFAIKHKFGFFKGNKHIGISLFRKNLTIFKSYNTMWHKVTHIGFLKFHERDDKQQIENLLAKIDNLNIKIDKLSQAVNTNTSQLNIINSKISNTTIKNKIVFANLLDKSSYACNVKYICEELLKRKLDCEIVWLVQNKNLHKSKFPPKIKLVEINTNDANRELMEAKIWINNSHAAFLMNINKQEGQTYIQTWHGSLGIKKVGSAICREESWWDKIAKNDMSMVDYCLTNSTFDEQMFKDLYYTGKLIKTGHPRCDIFFKDNTDVKKKVREEFFCDEDVKIALYAPTFRDNKKISCYSLDAESLKSALTERFGGKWVIAVRLHPEVKEMSKQVFKFNNWLIDATNYSDNLELLVSADCLIGDYSSVMYDYLFTGKPAFVFATDLQDYDQERGFYYPLVSTPFSIAMNNMELKNNIANFDILDYQKKVRNFLSKFECNEDGNSSKRAVDLIESILKETR